MSVLKILKVNYYIYIYEKIGKKKRGFKDIASEI